MLSKTITNIIRNNIQTYTMILALIFIWVLFGFLTDWIFLFTAEPL